MENIFFTLLSALEGIECPDCTHPLGLHADQYGCDKDRGDGWVTGSQAGAPTVFQALGPCGCKCESYPDLQKAIEAIRLAKNAPAIIGEAESRIYEDECGNKFRRYSGNVLRRIQQA
jgi:hypothetical protein